MIEVVWVTSWSSYGQNFSFSYLVLGAATAYTMSLLNFNRLLKLTILLALLKAGKLVKVKSVRLYHSLITVQAKICSDNVKVAYVQFVCIPSSRRDTKLKKSKN